MPEVKQPQKCLTQLMKLALRGEYRQGLKIVNKYLKLFPPTDEILLQRAFFLYHYAADLKYSRNTKKEKGRTLEIAAYFNQAIRACRKLIKRKRFLPQRIYLNARIYLAQIYVMLGRGKLAKTFARATYRAFPRVLTALRVADIHWRLNDLRGAMKWHCEAVRKVKNDDERAITYTGLAILHKHMGDTEKAYKESQKALKFVERSHNKKLLNPKLLKKLLYAHIPELRD